MYLKNLVIENMGSIERIAFTEEELFNEDKPKLLILVGGNGSGKTTLLSSIVDSFYEFAGQHFSNIKQYSGTSRKYFKLLGGNTQKINTNYGFSYLNFRNKENDGFYEYIEKVGNLSFSDCNNKTNNLLSLPEQNWINDDVLKLTTNISTNTNSKDDFIQNTYCYFPSDRFEHPYWMNTSYSKRENISEKIKYNMELNKSFLINQSLDEVKNWILDVYLDSRADIIENEEQYIINRVKDELDALNQSKYNIEKIISEIVEEEIKLGLNYRHHSTRISLNKLNKERNIAEIYLQSLNNLSAGQSTLLSIFCNIIKHSDEYAIIKSVNLEEIEGIVVIDEIDLHLHINLQKNVLPRLIKLFPKVQFIITTHSPFFLYGINESFNKNEYIIKNMPLGNTIDFDDFSEVKNSLDVFNKITYNYKIEIEQLKQKISATQHIPLIVTEGKTDWKHLKKAFERLKNDGQYTNLDIEFFEYEEEPKMGYDALDKLIDSMKLFLQPRKIIFMFDRDVDSINKKHPNEYQSHENKVYSFCIPKISDELNEICIEHYYSEDDLKTSDENNRRLFLGKEFHPNGNSICGNYQAKDQNSCKKNLAIIDEKVYDLKNDLEHRNSLALSKNNFAKNILNDVENFNNFNIENFKKIFDVIEKICNEGTTN